MFFPHVCWRVYGHGEYEIFPKQFTSDGEIDVRCMCAELLDDITITIYARSYVRFSRLSMSSGLVQLIPAEPSLNTPLIPTLTCKFEVCNRLKYRDCYGWCGGRFNQESRRRFFSRTRG